MTRHQIPFGGPAARAWRWSPLVGMAVCFGPVWTGPSWAADAEPAGSFAYTTRNGDTLIGLGRRFLLDPFQWPELARANKLPNGNRIGAGKTLHIPLRLMASEPVPALVAAAFGDVRTTGGAPVVAGQSLPEGAELRTDEGNATVRLIDGTVLRLRASSRVQIEESHRVPLAGMVRSGVRLQQGQVEVQAQPAAAGQPGFRIKTPQGALGVRGTEFRVNAQGNEGATRSEVLEGAVAAAGAAASPGQTVNAGFGVVVDSGGNVAPPVRLLPAPDLSALPALHEQPVLRFVLPTQAGAVAYRGQVSRSADFEQLLADTRVANGELRMADLADGDYVLRLRAEDANGLQGLNADHHFRLKARPEAPLPRAPAPRAIFSGDRVELAWIQNPDARSYRLQLARSEDFKAPVQDLRGLVASTWPLTGLPPGPYFWRLASERSTTDQGPFGAVQRFELRAVPAPLQAPQVSEHHLRLSWPGLPGQSFQLQVARDANFTNLVLERQLAAPALELELPGEGILVGHLFVRVRARDADGFVGPYTGAQSFDIPQCLRVHAGGCVKAGGQAIQISP